MFEYIAYRVEEYVKAHGGRLYYKLKARRSDPGNRSKLNPRYIVFVSFFAKRTNAPPAVIGGPLRHAQDHTARRQLEFMDGVLENVLPGAATMRKRLAAVRDSAEFIEFTGRGADARRHPHQGARLHGYRQRGDQRATRGSTASPASTPLLACTGRGHIVSAATAPGNRHDFYIMRKNPPGPGAVAHERGAPERRVGQGHEGVAEPVRQGVRRHGQAVPAHTGGRAAQGQERKVARGDQGGVRGRGMSRRHRPPWGSRRDNTARTGKSAPAGPWWSAP